MVKGIFVGMCFCFVKGIKLFIMNCFVKVDCMYLFLIGERKGLFEVGDVKVRLCLLKNMFIINDILIVMKE